MATASDSIEARRSISPNPPERIQAARAPNPLSILAEGESDLEKDEALVQRTTGRLLSRLQPNATPDSSTEEEEGDSDEEANERARRRLFAAKDDAGSSDEEEEDNGQGAYERMKQRLMASTSLQRRLAGEQTQDAPKPTAVPAASSSEDEDDAPVRAHQVRKLHTRERKTASPTASLSPPTKSRQSSPGLFVTPEPSPTMGRTPNVEISDDVSQRSSPRRNVDFRERVERIRAERLARQQEEKRRRAKNAQQDEDEALGSNSDGEGSRRFTQLAKPTRRAGKKALEAMARDQQRIVRNMQLTHQAKTKKRYGTKDLFAKFGFNQGIGGSDALGLPTPEASSLPVTSDAETVHARDTPPTSPPSFEDALGKDTTMSGLDESTHTSAKVDKGKGRAPEFQHLPPNQAMELAHELNLQQARVEPRKPTSEVMVDLDDSDDDLEVEKPKSRFPVFDKLPARKERENTSLLHLRHLAQLTSPGKKGPKGKNSMSMVQLQNTLFQKARQQAQKEREEKIEMLRARGIVIETEEEKEKRQMEIEDLVAQFEREKENDLKLAKRERELAKKNGEVGDGLISSDEDEDEDYEESGGEEGGDEVENAQDDELELSGSEEEEEQDDEEELDEEEEDLQGEAEQGHSDTLLDTMADEHDETSHETEGKAQDEEDDLLDAGSEAPMRKATTARVRKVVVDDEEEEEDAAHLNGSPTQLATQDDTMTAFGFNMAAPALGLTQAFAGTMANLESDSQIDQNLPQEPEQDSIDFLRSLPDSQPATNLSQRNDFFVPNSQPLASQQDDTQDGSIPPGHLGVSQLMEETSVFSQTQASELPEPTQDAGFVLSRSPAGLAPPQSTVDTVILPAAESPTVQRRGKLRRRHIEAPVVLSDVDEENVFSASDGEPEAGAAATSNAFKLMQKAAKKEKKIDDFNKKTSAAREHLDEQAYESDDEYKGLGGASDEDSGEEDGDLVEMIDTSDIKVDERKIAALFADKARKDHEAGIAKIYKDLQTGAFRKRGVGGAFDMSDSEDEAEMRRRKKQREFEQMVRALKQDETVGKMAENPKRKAFFNTLMDHSDDSDLEFLDAPEEAPAATSSSHSDEEKQDKSPEISIPDSQTADAPANPLKRKAPSEDSQEKENRPPPNLRRTAAADAMTRRPISAADIQNSVAELLEDPRDVIPDSQYISLSDSEEEDTPTLASRPTRTVTNRLSHASTTTTVSTTASNMAFQAPSASGALPGFRVPSLIRRATSNLSAASERSSSSSSFNRGKASEGAVRRGGTEKSNIHAQAREAERRALLEKKEAKRKEALKKKVEVGRKRAGAGSVLGMLGGGFE